jgi:hypothetical protein
MIGALGQHLHELGVLVALEVHASVARARDVSAATRAWLSSQACRSATFCSLRRPQACSDSACSS